MYDMNNLSRYWKELDYRQYALLQVALYLNGVQSIGKTAEILGVEHIQILDIVGRLERLYK